MPMHLSFGDSCSGYLCHSQNQEHGHHGHNQDQFDVHEIPPSQLIAFDMVMILQADYIQVTTGYKFSLRTYQGGRER